MSVKPSSLFSRTQHHSEGKKKTILCLELTFWISSKPLILNKNESKYSLKVWFGFFLLFQTTTMLCYICCNRSVP